jgi:hypothetical protein
VAGGTEAVSNDLAALDHRRCRGEGERVNRRNATLSFDHPGYHESRCESRSEGNQERRPEPDPACYTVTDVFVPYEQYAPQQRQTDQARQAKPINHSHLQARTIPSGPRDVS